MPLVLRWSSCDPLQGRVARQLRPHFPSPNESFPSFHSFLSFPFPSTNLFSPYQSMFCHDYPVTSHLHASSISIYFFICTHQFFVHRYKFLATPSFFPSPSYLRCCPLSSCDFAQIPWKIGLKNVFPFSFHEDIGMDIPWIRGYSQPLSDRSLKEVLRTCEKPRNTAIE